MNQAWKKRLYEAYVSSGQASELHKYSTELLAQRKPHFQMLIKRHVPANKNSNILDLGCGYGALLYFLFEAGYHNLHGVDASAEQVALARELGLATVEQQEIDAYLASLEDASVDIVFLMDVLEHFQRQQLFDTLDEVFRVLRPGGKCIAHVPNGTGLYAMRVRYGDLTHELAFTRRSAHQLFSTIGFRDTQCFEDRPVIHGPVSALRSFVWFLGTLPARLLMAAETGRTSSILSQNMIVTAVKPANIHE